MKMRIITCDNATAPLRAVVRSVESGSVHDAMAEARCIHDEYPAEGLAVEWLRETAGGPVWGRYAYFHTTAQREAMAVAEVAAIQAKHAEIKRAYEVAEAEKRRKKLLPTEKKKPAGMYD